MFEKFNQNLPINELQIDWLSMMDWSVFRVSKNISKQVLCRDFRYRMN